jgi:uncharacterized membrane protein YbhN (UPF0104 family)
VAKFALAAGLVAWLCTGRLDLGRLASAPLSLDLALLFVLVLSSMLLPAVRWWWLLKVQQIDASLWQAVKLTWIGYATALFLPGAASGDLAKGCLIVREQPTARLRSLSTVIVDRVVGVYSLLMLGCLSAGWFMLTTPVGSPLRSISAVMIWLLVGVTLAMAVALLGPWRHLLTHFTPVSWLEAWGESYRLYRQSGPALLGCLVLSLVSSALTAASLASADHALGGDVSWSSSLLVGPLVVLANCLPITPGGVGVAEAAASGLFVQAGSADGADMMLTLRLAMATLSLPALLILIGRRRSRINAPPQPATDATATATPRAPSRAA